MFYKFAKRLFDILAASFGILLLSPILLLIAVIVKLDSPGPVMFKQKRIGIHKRFFNILKFRTMRTDTPRDTPTHLLTGATGYVTKSGSFLRKTSLDELPQLFNIFAGQMSFVGPRPALWNQDDLIAERDKYGANDVSVGLTGWAQINGRDELPIPDKARLDGEYVCRCGFWFDMYILLKTIFVFLNGVGVVEGGTGALGYSDKNKEEPKP